MIRRMMGAAAAVVLSLAAVQSAAGQTTATVTYEVAAINELTFSGDPGKLLIDASSKLSGVADSTTTWSVSTNGTDMKVTGAVSTLPSGVTLAVQLEAPSGATSVGSTALGTTAVDLVTGITQVEAIGLPVIYTLSATTAAGVVAEATATVTYTIVAGV